MTPASGTRLSTDADQIFDVEAFTFGMADIEKHMHRYRKKVPQTLARQQRLRRRWELQRGKLHRRTTWSVERIQEWQLERVSALVDYAYNVIPLYRHLYGECGFRTGDILTWDDFNRLPVITKDDLRRGFPAESVLAGVDPDECYGARTSGSTGVPLSIVRDDVSSERWMIHRLRQFELMLGERMRDDDWIYNIYLSTWAFTSFTGAYPTFSISEDCPPAAVYQHIQRLRPKVVSVFPSFLARLAEQAGDLSAHGVGCICTNSESSSRSERQTFAEHFGVPVLDEYATEELTIVATECRHGRYHVVEDRVRVDVAEVDEDGLGHIVATDLSNIYMPIIRYSQGDLIQWGGDIGECECGNRFRYLERFVGRADQALESRTIGRVPPDRLMNLCDRTFVSYESRIAEFRVIQELRDGVRVLLVTRGGAATADGDILEEFRAGLVHLFQDDIAVDFEYCQALPRLPSYKRRMIVNQLR